MKIIALDFDGVIVNSVNECLLVGYYAYQKFAEPSIKLKSIENLSDSELKLLTSYRPFVLSGEDYVFISMALELNHHFKNQSDYDKFKLENIEYARQFYKMFQNERSNLLNTNRKLWFKLNEFFIGMESFMRINCSSDNLIIISTKPKIFIIEILKNHNINFDEQRIFHASNVDTKKDIIRRFLSDNSIEPNNFFFIDDQISTLKDVKSLAINCFLAEWGYNTKIEAVDAVKNHIPVITISDFHNSDEFVT